MDGSFGGEPLPLGARPLTGGTGAEIGAGTQLRDLGDGDIATLKRLVSDWCVVVARDQFLQPQELAAFGEKLGPLDYTPGLVRNTEWENVYRIQNYGKQRASTESWHTDGCFSERPPAYTALSAATLPPVGGDTIFVNQYLAYEALSPRFKTMLRGLRAEHVWNGAPHLRDGGEAPRALHPLVRTHPLTGRRAVYIGIPRMMGLIEGLTEAESRLLTDYLYESSIAIDRTYRHQWRDGDVLIWDNRCSLHAAAHDYGEAERVLFRIVTQGEAPYEDPYA
jgi:taurine dioxygenase